MSDPSVNISDQRKLAIAARIHRDHPEYSQDWLERLVAMTTEFEGASRAVYTDSTGHPTVGLGFNLDRTGEDRDEPLRSVGLRVVRRLVGENGQVIDKSDVEVEKVLGSRDCKQQLARNKWHVIKRLRNNRGDIVDMTDAQVDQLFACDFPRFIAATHRIFPDLDRIPPAQRAVLVDMTFNLGPYGLDSWPKFRAHIAARNWDEAANAMAKTLWARQTGRRAERDIALMREGWPDRSGGLSGAETRHAGSDSAPELTLAERTTAATKGASTDGLLPEASLMLQAAGFGRKDVTQGLGYATDSSGTHSAAVEGARSLKYGTAADISVAGLNVAGIRERLERLRRAGFAAWYRPRGWMPHGKGSPHIHGVYAGSPTMLRYLRWQIYNFENDRTGLGYSNPSGPEGPNERLHFPLSPAMAPDWQISAGLRAWIAAIYDLRSRLTPAATAYIEQVARGAAQPDPARLRQLCTGGAPRDPWRLIVNWLDAGGLKNKDSHTYVPVDVWRKAFADRPVPPGVAAEQVDGVACYPLRALVDASGLKVATDAAAKRNYVYDEGNVKMAVRASMLDYLSAAGKLTNTTGDAHTEAQVAMGEAIRQALVTAAPLWLGYAHMADGPEKDAELRRVRELLEQIAASRNLLPLAADRWVQIMMGNLARIEDLAPGQTDGALLDQVLLQAKDDEHAGAALARADGQWSLTTRDGDRGPVLWADGRAWVSAKTWAGATGLGVPPNAESSGGPGTRGPQYSLHDLASSAGLVLKFDYAKERVNLSRPTSRSSTLISPVLLTRAIGPLARYAEDCEAVAKPASIANLVAATRAMLHPPVPSQPTPVVVLGTSGEPLPQARTFREKLWQHHGEIDRMVAQHLRMVSWRSLD